MEAKAGRIAQITLEGMGGNGAIGRARERELISFRTENPLRI